MSLLSIYFPCRTVAMANCGWLYSILWFLLLIFIAFPVGMFAAFWYLIFSSMIPCCLCSKGIADFCHKGRVNLKESDSYEVM